MMFQLEEQVLPLVHRGGTGVFHDTLLARGGVLPFVLVQWCRERGQQPLPLPFPTF